MAIGDVVRVRDRMQQGYSYRLEAAVGRSFAPDFRPALTPAEVQMARIIPAVPTAIHISCLRWNPPVCP